MPASAPPDTDAFEDPYTWPGTSVLKNLLGIRDQGILDVAERKLTWVRRQQIHIDPIVGAFDLDHLCAIHHWLFQDLFAWAGRIRKETGVRSARSSTSSPHGTAGRTHGAM